MCSDGWVWGGLTEQGEDIVNTCKKSIISISDC